MTLLLVQLGVLALTAVLWWRARLDLTARAAGLPPASEWERLRRTVEQLTADLERRAVVAEQRVSAAEERLRAGSVPLHREAPSGRESLPALETEETSQEPEPDRYAQAELLIAQGADDPAELMREAGITRGEAELLLSLRARRTL